MRAKDFVGMLKSVKMTGPKITKPRFKESGKIIRKAEQSLEGLPGIERPGKTVSGIEKSEKTASEVKRPGSQLLLTF